jgi:nucleoside-diphosphate-sugar epimerase
MRVLVVGCGYVGQPTAELLARAGHEVIGASRKPQVFDAKVTPLACDITNEADVRRLPDEVDWMVNTVSSSKGGVEDYRAIFIEGTRNLLKRVRCKRYLFTSSTSVYAQADGSVVTEESAAEPKSETSRVLREAEEVVFASGVPAIVLRLAGIYGPGRGALFMQYLRREAVIRGDGSRFLNMVHRDDVAGAVIACLERGRSSEIYNIADNEPVTELEFFDWLEKELRQNFRPPRVPESTLAGRKRGLTNKRVANEKLRREIGYSFKFPTFREGYRGEIERVRATASTPDAK